MALDKEDAPGLGTGSTENHQDSDEDESSSAQKKKSQATLLVELVDQHQGLELFHAPDHKPYAYIPVAQHFETWPLRSRAFRRWTAGLFFQAQGTAPGSQAIQDALAVLEARALFDGPEIRVYVRMAKYQDDIFLDLGCDEWHAVHITTQGWRVVGSSPVRFRRPSGMQALPHPDPEGSIEELRGFVNLKPGDWPLFLGVLVAMFHPDMPYPVANFLGEQGSAKTTTCRTARSLIDPSSAPVRSSPRSERDLMVAATSSWVTVIDNLSYIPDWLSDSIARLSTGGGMAVRELYTDDEPFLFDARRPVIMNGITEVVTRPDLLDRCVMFDVPRLSEHRYEEDLWAEFEEVRPGILGVLLDGVAFGLKNLPNVRRRGLPRMADFARWAMACAPVLGIRPEEFLEAYKANRRAANTLALDASPIAASVLQFMEGRERWTGTVVDLLHELNRLASEVTQRDKAWPGSGRKLSGDLRRIAPNLRRAGIEVTPPGPNERPRNWTLEQSRIGPSEPSEPSERAPDLRERPDGSSDTSDGSTPHTVGTVGELSGKTAGGDGSDTSDGLLLPRSKSIDDPTSWCVRCQRYGRGHRGAHTSIWPALEEVAR
jgi:hypothetical protein